MPATTKTIETYKLTFPAANGATISYGPLRAWLHFYEASNTRAIAEIRFYDPDQLSNHPNRTDAYGMPVCSMSLTELSLIIDTLRNEKPMSIMWDAQRKLLLLFTDREGVGEAEISP